MLRESPFQNIAIVTKPRGDLSAQVQKIIDIVSRYDIQIFVDENTARALGNKNTYRVMSILVLADMCDVAITIGGDGTMIGAAREFALKRVPIIGINAGRLGFITDISINQTNSILPQMLEGHYVTDTRSILRGSVIRNGKTVFSSLSANDIGICHGQALGMVEYMVRVNGEFMASQRGDGLLVSTATGSTAYALSAGGPILHPATRSVLLVPIAPHTLTNRPVILHSSSKLDIEIVETRSVVVSFDAQVNFDAQVGDVVHIEVANNASFIMLHPVGYSHFDLLRRKLHWGHLPTAENPIHEKELTS